LQRITTAMKRFVSSFIVVLALLPFVCQAQTEQKSIRVAFWNVENYFDPFVDSIRSYNDFTENGVQHWTKTRFYNKRNNLYKTILALSENRSLGILGLCEVENEYALLSLFAWTPLKKHNYRWVHYEGPDRRSIEPAIVYSLDQFMLVESAVIPYRNPEDTAYHTRDILYAKFVEKGEPSAESGTLSDTLHVFVNHWPSRYSGELETMGLRSCAATILRSKVDSIMAAATEGYQPKIIMMGDFNDNPYDPSIYNVLRARYPSEKEEGCLINLFGKPEDLGFEGTMKHLDDWHTFDQIIVTEGIMQDKQGLHYLVGSARIFHPDLLLEDDVTHRGKKPYRTYLGPRYLGGFSDHLPVYIDLVR